MMTGGAVAVVLAITFSILFLSIAMAYTLFTHFAKH